MSEPIDPLQRGLVEQVCPEFDRLALADPESPLDLRTPMGEAAELWERASELWWEHELDALAERASLDRDAPLPGDPDWRPADWRPETVEQARRVFFELRSSSQIDPRRPPGPQDLRALIGRALPTPLLCAMLAAVAAFEAADALAQMAREIEQDASQGGRWPLDRLRHEAPDVWREQLRKALAARGDLAADREYIEGNIAGARLAFAAGELAQAEEERARLAERASRAKAGRTRKLPDARKARQIRDAARAAAIEAEVRKRLRNGEQWRGMPGRIARALGVSRSTADAHVRRVRALIEAENCRR